MVRRRERGKDNESRSKWKGRRLIKKTNITDKHVHIKSQQGKR